MSQNVKFLETDDDNVELIRNSDRYLATIESRIKFTYELVKENGSVYHIPPESSDSSFRQLLISLGLRKNSPYRKYFNKM